MRLKSSIIIAAAGLLGLLGGCKTTKVQSAGGFPPTPVSVAVATEENVPVDIRAVGTVEASAVVQVKSQIAGELVSVHFAEGADIKKNELLFQIDPRPYQDALKQAQAAVLRDSAQLKQAEANLGRDQAQFKNAQADAKRYEELSKAGVVSTQQYLQFQTNADALQESIRADQAAIESARASVESDRTAVERARLDLTYCEIRSPVNGRAGNLLVHAGNLVQANGSIALVVINQIEPIWVSFGVPEHQLSAIRQSSAARQLPVRVSLQDNSGKIVTGLLTVIDNAVDPATGTIKLKATFDNQDRVLWPGQFVNVALTLDTRTNAVLVPSEAVQVGQQGQFIYVVKSNQTVEPRPVTVGVSTGSRIVIEKGVAAGETVVTDGQLRLFPGAKIVPVPAAKVDSQKL